MKCKSRNDPPMSELIDEDERSSQSIISYLTNIKSVYGLDMWLKENTFSASFQFHKVQTKLSSV